MPNQKPKRIAEPLELDHWGIGFYVDPTALDIAGREDVHVSLLSIKHKLLDMLRRDLAAVNVHGALVSIAVIEG